MRAALHIVLALLVAGCSDGTAEVCDPGDSQTCLCPEGLEGTQECDDDGGGWGACSCGPTDATTEGDIAFETPTNCTADGDCDDRDPCTLDICMDDTCIHEDVDEDADGYAAGMVDGNECGGSDCDDRDVGVYPGADHGCEEGDDRDCDTIPDLDEDGDGHQDEGCGGGDCDDEDDTVFPGSLEVDCSDTDHDCNGLADRDNDGDGYDRDECGGSDCDDEHAGVHLSTPEVPCNGRDDDCDGRLHVVEDTDRDGFPGELCAETGMEVDCDDADLASYPGAPEVCDQVDQDCDGSWAEAGADDDADGHLDVACGGNDCDDTLDTIFDGAPEVCDDGVDQDCDTIADDLTAMIPDVRVTNDDLVSMYPSLAWTGSEYGVTWADGRPGTEEIYFARISPAGVKLGPDSRITTSGERKESTSLAWTGSEYGVAWMDDRAGRREVYFTRISPTGTAVGAQVRVTDDPANVLGPSIVWSGSQFGVAWPDFRVGRYQIYFARLSATGTKLGTDVRASDTVFWIAYPSLAWTGSEYGLTWSRYSSADRIGFVRLTAGGVKVGSDIEIVTTSSRLGASSLVWSGSEYGLAWSDTRPGNEEIYFLRFSSAGTPLGADTRISTDSDPSGFPAMAWTGTEYVATWRSGSSAGNVMLGRISASGSAIGSPLLITTPSNVRYGTIVWGGSEVGVAWNDNRGGNEEIFFSRVDHCE